ncbi:NADP-dependent phosphogluconate dehydrogenase [Telmatospirillum sp.]|uniref:NADP-dependent phosphogluconate dehydrogenase n=1 Tax=Telmatospirillum sp. TaxID=2079197 RepID=UPI00283D2395|nr:NADP-dependent phosphogluconate dehydrogenase [Telmatospirillum sp.]MDR3437858.1 NADP-dependent phosphogluconate dehydrogenase [Telmatospirillum sp.]
MTTLCDIGVIGLATMGGNLARNAARKGFGVAIYNRHAERTDTLLRDHGQEGHFTAARTLTEFVASLKRPRAIIMMVKAGKPVDDLIGDLQPLLQPGDILIDGGNSLFSDTQRRSAEVTLHQLRYIGMGVSGGEEGALEGPSMMPGGDRDAYAQIEPIVTRMAAQVDGTPCCRYIGPDGAGHFVKMVHNGIEYADMQLIAEAYDLLRGAYGLPAEKIADIFAGWQEGDLDSYLIEITAAVLRKRDELTGQALVDVILDEAGQKGTGRWTSHSALDLGIPVTAITEAVFARALSSQRGQRVMAAKLLGKRPSPAIQFDDQARNAIRDALYASKIVAYSQGFEQIEAASREFGWTLDLGALASIWRGGCIIRAKFLDRIAEAYAGGAEPGNLLMQRYFRDGIAKAEGSWRDVVVTAVRTGIAVPALAASLAYFDGLRRESGPANLIQGQRDYFGAHTYRRTDRPGSFHVRWSQDGREVETDA